MSELRAIQNWMQIVIEGNATSDVDDVVVASSTMTAEERLAVYQRAYLARLVECMRAEFPMLCRSLGEDLFDEFAADYLRQYPSTSYTLTKLGANFSTYLANTRPPDSGADEWFATLVDLAVLEWATNEVFDGPGTENEPPPAPNELNSLAATHWESLRLQLAPSVRLLELRYPVQEYYRQLRDGVEATPPGASRTFVVVARRDYTVRHHALSEPQWRLLKAFANDCTLAESVAAAAACVENLDLDKFTAELHEWFAWFASERFFRAVSLG